MAYYVPLGPRGLLMRLGSLVLVVAGGLVYWRSSRRRTGIGIPSRLNVFPRETDA